MKKNILGIIAGLLLFTSQQAIADDNEKISPDYICAQYLALASTASQGPLFQALQIDGFVSSVLGTTWADPDIIQGMMKAVYPLCEQHPADPVVLHWEEIKRKVEDPVEKQWDADATLCQQYIDHPDDASGFIIWLDAYNRHYNATQQSILVSDDAIKKFTDACTQRPNDRMLDVLKDSLPEK